MAIIDVAELIKPISRDQALADLIVLAQSMKIRASSWRIGSTSRFWVMALAEMASRFSVQNALTATQGLNSVAFGNGLAKFSKSRYDNTKIKAVKTQGKALLTDTGSVGPVDVAIGERVFIYKDDPSITYRNIDGGTLALDGTLELTIEAEVGGAAHNVDVDTIDEMNPTVAGVTVTNPANPTDWITQLGVDEESDAALRKRNPSRWNTLGGNAPAGAYEFWALTATTEPDGTGDPVGITRVFVDDQNPGGPGTIYVYIADSSGTASAAQVTDVQDYINARKARASNVTVFAAVPLPITITGTFHVTTGLGTIRKTQIETDVTAFINSLPIGGEDIGETLGRVLESAIVEVAMAPDGVKRVALTAPTADVTVQPNEVVTVSGVTFTATEV